MVKGKKEEILFLGKTLYGLFLLDVDVVKSLSNVLLKAYSLYLCLSSASHPIP